MTQPRILVTNDDGIHASALHVLVEHLAEAADVWVYAPEGQQSAVGHGVSLHRPLRVTPWRGQWFMVDGTPTDCVMLAVRDLLKPKPDLVVSGINPGPNLGDDVTYSGTVAGAFEGMLLGLPAIAVSMVHDHPKHAETGARFAVKLAQHVLEHGLPGETMLNVNVPDLSYDALAGVAVTRMGRRDYQDVIEHRVDPRGRSYYWIGGYQPSHVAEPGTDFDAVEQNKISITPLRRDLTHHAAVDALAEEGFSL